MSNKDNEEILYQHAESNRNGTQRGRDARGRFLPGNQISKGHKGGARPGDIRNVKYPGRIYFERRALRKHDKWVRYHVERYCAELIADKGGAEEATAGERRLIEVASAARAGWMQEIIAGGERNRQLAARFMQVETQALRQIGLERRAKEINDLDAYVKAKYGSKGEE